MTTTSQSPSGHTAVGSTKQPQCGQARTFALAPKLAADGFTFLAASTEKLLTSSRIDSQPISGVDVKWKHPIDPQSTTRKDDLTVNAMLNLYNYLNGLSFGEKGLGMPNWVMWDLALLPSVLVIITTENRTRFDDLIQEMKRAREELGETPKSKQVALDKALERAMELSKHVGADYDGPVPVAGYCAAPTPVDGHWVGWSMCSLEIPGRNLATVAKGAALAIYKATVLDGVTQYGNRAIGVHAQFGPTRIRMPLLEGHTAPNTFVYETEVFAPDKGSTHDAPTFEAANEAYSRFCDEHENGAFEELLPQDTEAQLRLRDRVQGEDFFILPSVPWNAEIPLRIQARKK